MILTRNRELSRSGIMSQVVYFRDSRFDFTSFATQLVNDSARLAIIDNPKKRFGSLQRCMCIYREVLIDRSINIQEKRAFPTNQTTKRAVRFVLTQLL